MNHSQSRLLNTGSDSQHESLEPQTGRRVRHGQHNRSSTIGTTGSSVDFETNPQCCESQCVVLVHGFKGSQSFYKNSLKRWHEESRKRNIERDISMVKFKFDMEKVLKGTRKISEESDRLKVFLANIDTNQPHKARFSGDGLDNATPSEHRNSPLFILVGYNLGSWVVRDLVWRYRHEPMIVNTSSIISLDSLEISATREVADYRSILTQTNKKFLLRVKSDISPLLAEQLASIDRCFQADLASFSRKKSASKVEETHLNIWMGSNRLERSTNRVQRGINFLTRSESRDDRVMRVLDRVDEEIDRAIARANERKLDPRPTIYMPERRLEPISEGSSDGGSARRPSMMSIASRPLSYAGRSANELVTVRTDGKILVPSQNKDIDQVQDLAAECIENGEFRHAEALLKQGVKACKDLLDQSAPNSLLREPLTHRIRDVQLQRIVISLHLGYYSEATRDLTELVQTLRAADNFQYLDLKVEACKWLSYSLVLQGNYQQAVDHYTQLLENSRGKDNVQFTMSKRSTVAIYRDLAMAYAHLGKFDKCMIALQDARDMIEISFPSGVSGLSDQETKKHMKIRLTLVDNLVMVEARVNLLLGKYKNGLAKAEVALKGMTRRLGRKHIKTLECAKLKAELQALDSDVLAAEQTCRDTLRSMRSQFGEDHPQTLETMLVLAFIFRSQERLVESVDLAASVHLSLEKNLGKNHSATLNAMAELAASHRSTGSYISASEVLHELVQRSQQAYARSHPNTLHYLSEMAHVYSFSGYNDAAESLTIAVLRKQWSIYAPVRKSLMYHADQLPKSAHTTPSVESSPGDHVSLPSDTVIHPITEVDKGFRTDGLVAQILAEMRFEVLSLQHQNRTRSMKMHVLDQSRPTIHPFLLHTLEVLSKVEMGKARPDLALVRDILTSTLSWRAETLGPHHSSTLHVEFELSDVERKSEQLKQAKDRLFKVLTLRQRFWEQSHPLTLIALREYLITGCALEPPEPAYSRHETGLGTGAPKIQVPTLDMWNSKTRAGVDIEFPKAEPQVEACSRAILKYQEERLGRLHPQVLKTLLWLFILHLDIDSRHIATSSEDRQATQLAKDIIQRVKEQTVLKERAYDSLQMQNTIVRFYKDYGFEIEAVEIEKRMISSGDFERDCQRALEIVDGQSRVLNDLSKQHDVSIGYYLGSDSTE